jgi:hypothetical protein
LVSLAGKKKSLITYFVFLYLPAIALFYLSGSSNLSQFISVSFFVVLTAVSLGVLAIMPNDEKYYENLNFQNFLYSLGLGVGMIALSVGLSLQLKNEAMLNTVNNTFWMFDAPLGLETSTLSLTSSSSSVFFGFLGVAMSGLVMAATAEELFRLPAYAYGKDEYGKGYKIKNLVIPGVIIFVGYPVAFWAALHGIQAYSNLVMIIPAAVNGVALTIYLWKTRCILGCIFSHFLYNLGVTAFAWMRGASGLPVGTPFLPIYIANLPLFIASLALIFSGLGILLAVKNKGIWVKVGSVLMMLAGGFICFRYGTALSRATLLLQPRFTTACCCSCSLVQSCTS